MDPRAEATSAETIAVVRTPGAGSSKTDSSLSRSSSSIPEEGRFVPGTLLGGRYRIIALLGRGGMGEVYRATDLTLGQSVALKFLPAEAAQNQHLLERFHGEVRVARQVTHPNVCRVYDIGEVEGTPFISMEYVDGEDLSSLLTRIGRLPADKAIETARGLCAGLAAAHDRGIVHRDLKPQNIMMNKRGEVLIMDFGLAAIADQLSVADIHSGTPAYMAPEQLRGAEVTAKSDIYSLGLVIYELFTGRRPYEAKTVRQMLDLQEAVQLTNMSSIAADIDPAVEKIVRRCLDPDPVKRPVTARAVAAALPGGDPLSVAMAAGETPSPELVAAAGETKGLARKFSVPCLVVVVASLFAAPVIRQRGDAMMRGPLDFSPDVLAEKSREVANTFGYPKKPMDSALRLEYRQKLLAHLNHTPEPRKWEQWLAAESPVLASYRESQAPLVAQPLGRISDTNPPPIEPGMISVKLDGAAHLREFSAIPYRTGQDLPAPVPPETVFRAAGLDPAKFTETTPDRQPSGPADVVRAWKGPHPEIPNVELWVEMAFWKGRVTTVQVWFPWDRPMPPETAGHAIWIQARDLYPMAGMLLALFFAALLGRRNWKLGRVDRNGALRIAAVSLMLDVIGWLGDVHAVPTSDMLDLFQQSAANALFGAAILWVVYLALEPAVRSRWPHSIVTWNRILAGRWLDPPVASHILMGAAAGCAIWTLFRLIHTWAEPPDRLVDGGSLFVVLGTRQWVAGLAYVAGHALAIGLIGFFAIFGLRVVLRKDLLAALAASVLFTFLEGSVTHSDHWMTMAVFYFCVYAALTLVLLHFGLLATISAVCFINGFNFLTLGLDWKAWYASSGLATLLLLLTIAGLAFWRSLGARGLLGTDSTSQP